MTATGSPAQRAILSQLGHWTAELVLVFLGVYAAFWLSNYQQHRQEGKRRDQMLAALEEEMKEGVASTKTNRAEIDRQTDEFRRALDAGHMPPLRPFAFTTDYSAGDIAGMLQAGGYDLLEVKTLNVLRNTESVIRGGLARMKHYQDLSDELITPNLDQDISYFYDPATKQLRKKFARYPDMLQSAAEFFRDLEKAQTDLLNQIRAERQRH
jgi:hypothetical protein